MENLSSKSSVIRRRSTLSRLRKQLSRNFIGVATAPNEHEHFQDDQNQIVVDLDYDHTNKHLRRRSSVFSSSTWIRKPVEEMATPTISKAKVEVTPDPKATQSIRVLERTKSRTSSKHRQSNKKIRSLPPPIVTHPQDQKTKSTKKRNSKVLELSIGALQWLQKAAASNDTNLPITPPSHKSPSSSILPSPTTESHMIGMPDLKMTEKGDKLTGRLTLKIPTLPRIKIGKNDNIFTDELFDNKDNEPPVFSEPVLPTTISDGKKVEKRSIISLRGLSRHSTTIVDSARGIEGSKGTSATLNKIKNALTWSSQHQSLLDRDVEVLQQSKGAGATKKSLLGQKTNESLKALRSDGLISPVAFKNYGDSSTGPPVRMRMNEKQKRRKIPIHQSNAVNDGTANGNPKGSEITSNKAQKPRPFILESEGDADLRNRPRYSYDSSMHVKPLYNPIPITRPVSGLKMHRHLDDEYFSLWTGAGCDRNGNDNEFLHTTSSSTLVDEANIVEIEKSLVEAGKLEVIIAESISVLDEKLALYNLEEEPSIESSSTTTTATRIVVSMSESLPQSLSGVITENKDSVDMPKTVPLELPPILEQLEPRLDMCYPQVSPNNTSESDSIESNDSKRSSNIYKMDCNINMINSKHNNTINESREGNFEAPKSMCSIPEVLITPQSNPKPVETESLINLSGAPIPVPVEAPHTLSHAFTDLMGLVASNGIPLCDPVWKVVASPIIEMFDPIKDCDNLAELPRNGSKKSLVNSISLSLPEFEGYSNSLASTPTTSTSPSTPFPITPSAPRSPVSSRAKDSMETDILGATVNKAQRQVLSEYIATRNDEMMVSIGDSILVTAEFSDGWALGHNQTTGEHGIFPLIVFEEEYSSSDGSNDIERDELSSSSVHTDVELEKTTASYIGERADEYEGGGHSHYEPPLSPIIIKEPITPVSIISSEQKTRLASTGNVGDISNFRRRSSTFGYLLNTITTRDSPALPSANTRIPSPPQPESPSICHVMKPPPTLPPRSGNAASAPALLSTFPLLHVHHDLTPTRPDELEIHAGDVVIVEAAYADGWGYGHLVEFDSDSIGGRRNSILANEKGWVPICYLGEEEPEVQGSSGVGVFSSEAPDVTRSSCS